MHNPCQSKLKVSNAEERHSLPAKSFTSNDKAERTAFRNGAESRRKTWRDFNSGRKQFHSCMRPSRHAFRNTASPST